eukprot:5479560-Pyramimonas_sp.AAC.1
MATPYRNVPYPIDPAHADAVGSMRQGTGIDVQQIIGAQPLADRRGVPLRPKLGRGTGDNPDVRKQPC